MNSKKNKEKITAYIDNELKSQEELRQFEEELKNDKSLEFELKTEALTKQIVSEKVKKTKTPDSTRNGISDVLLNEFSKRKNRFSFAENISSRKFLTLSTLGIILLAVILILLNRPDLQTSTQKISEQFGNNNMLVIAQNNFEQLVNGNNSVQFISNKPSELQEFFKEQGVNYNTVIPEFEKYKLLGGFVTNHNGVKLAHHIYVCKNGKYIYILQVDEDYFKGDSIIRLSNDLLSYLEKGNHYKTNGSEYVSILKKQDKNVLAVISNLPEEDLPKSIYR